MDALFSCRWLVNHRKERTVDTNNFVALDLVSELGLPNERRSYNLCPESRAKRARVIIWLGLRNQIDAGCDNLGHGPRLPVTVLGPLTVQSKSCPLAKQTGYLTYNLDYITYDY